MARAAIQLKPAVAHPGRTTALNPDAWIAERNIDRYETTTGRLDLEYLSGLSADAVPVLLRLPAPLRDCALARQVERLRGTDDPWFDPNQARDRARELLARTQIGPCADPTRSAVRRTKDRGTVRSVDASKG